MARDKLATQYVYVISTVKDGEHVAPVKIGQTGSLKSRLAMLQTGSPNDLDITFAFPLAGRDFADWVEKTCHKAAEAYGLRGEWFDLHPNRALQLVASAIRTICEMHDRSGLELEADLFKFGVYDAFFEAEKRWPELVPAQ